MPMWRMEPIMLTITKSTSSKISSNLPQQSQSQGQANERAPLKVLVVDDHCLIREVLCDLLKQLRDNTVVMEAANGKQAMQLVAERQDIDLILLDMSASDRDGFTILNWI